MKIIGVTGSIATGKSTVAGILKYLGAEVIDLDRISRQVCAAGSPATLKIQELFGIEYIKEDQSIDRKKLGRLIFTNPQKRKLLEDILHPLIIAEVNSKIADLKSEKPDSVVIVEAPLLIESGLYQSMDEVWVVAADEGTRIDRLMKRDGITREEAILRIKSQMSQEEKIRYADVVIDNTGNLAVILKEFGDLYAAK